MPGAALMGETMTIHTASTLRARARRVDHKLKSADVVLNRMREGDALHLQHTPRGPDWRLSSGLEVADVVAKAVIKSSSIVSVDTALFEGLPAQTWRWWTAA
jgi:hypothetical protein